VGRRRAIRPRPTCNGRPMNEAEFRGRSTRRVVSCVSRSSASTRTVVALLREKPKAGSRPPVARQHDPRAGPVPRPFCPQAWSRTSRWPRPETSPVNRPSAQNRPLAQRLLRRRILLVHGGASAPERPAGARPSHKLLPSFVVSGFPPRESPAQCGAFLLVPRDARVSSALPGRPVVCIAFSNSGLRPL